MRSKTLLLLGLMAVFLTVTAENCVLKTKEIEVPARASDEVTFTTAGDSEHSGSETVDFSDDLNDLESDNDFLALLDANIEAGYWRVVENRGDADLVISGAVTVTRLNPSKTSVLALAQTTQPLISYTSVPIASVLGDYQVAPLSAAGVALLNEGFDEYLLAKAQNLPLPDLRYRFDWAGVATKALPPGVVDVAQPTVDFDWQAKVKFILTGLVEVDVPELY